MISEFLQPPNRSSCFQSCPSQIHSTPVTELILKKKNQFISKSCSKHFTLSPLLLKWRNLLLNKAHLLPQDPLIWHSATFSLTHLIQPPWLPSSSLIWPRPFSSPHLMPIVACFSQILPGFSSFILTSNVYSSNRSSLTTPPNMVSLPTLVTHHPTYFLHYMTTCVNLCLMFPLLKCRSYRDLLCVVYKCNMGF